MKRWLERIRCLLRAEIRYQHVRGVIGMGLTWAAVWGGAGAILGVVAAVLGLDPAGVITEVAIIGAIAGFMAGATFSTVLGMTEGRRRFDEMSLPRFAFWGALGGLLLSGFLTATATLSSETHMIVLAYGVFPLLAAGCAAGSLALARGADDRELLEHGADVADIGLTEEEKRDLLLGK